MRALLLSKRIVASGITASLALVSLSAWSMGSFSSSQPTMINNTIKLLGKNMAMHPKEVTIRIGQQGKEWVAMYPNAVQVNDKNAHGAIAFYDIDWPNQGPLGTVHIDNADNSFIVPNVMGVMGTAQVHDYPGDGIEKFNLSVSVSPRNNVLHSEALLQFYALLKTIQTAGWKREIGVSLPRINGRDALLYSQELSYFSADANYVPTLNEWMKIDQFTHWRFYANDVYLDVTFMRDNKKMDPDQPGAYLITLNLRGADAVQRTYFKEKDRPNYKELYPAERKRLAKMRRAAEQKIKSKYHIDETYVDPDGETLAPGWIRQGEVN